jgi:hypothetical protein
MLSLLTLVSQMAGQEGEQTSILRAPPPKENNPSRSIVKYKRKRTIDDSTKESVTDPCRSGDTPADSIHRFIRFVERKSARQSDLDNLLNGSDADALLTQLRYWAFRWTRDTRFSSGRIYGLELLIPDGPENVPESKPADATSPRRNKEDEEGSDSSVSDSEPPVASEILGESADTPLRSVRWAPSTNDSNEEEEDPVSDGNPVVNEEDEDVESNDDIVNL